MSQEDWIKTLAGFVASTLGFLIALLVNTYVGWLREKKAYWVMLKAVEAEAIGNKVILNESFLRFYDSGIVIREFSLIAVSQYLSDQVFINNADQSIIELLGAYVRTLRLANAYREKAEHLLLDSQGKKSKDWLDGIVMFWGENLKQCGAMIDRVLKVANAS